MLIMVVLTQITLGALVTVEHLAKPLASIANCLNIAGSPNTRHKPVCLSYPVPPTHLRLDLKGVYKLKGKGLSGSQGPDKKLLEG